MRDLQLGSDCWPLFASRGLSVSPQDLLFPSSGSDILHRSLPSHNFCSSLPLIYTIFLHLYPSPPEWSQRFQLSQITKLAILVLNSMQDFFQYFTSCMRKFLPFSCICSSLNSQVLQQVKTFLYTETHWCQVNKEKKKQQLFRGQATALCLSPGITQARTGSMGEEFDLVGELFCQISQLTSWHCPKGDNAEIPNTSTLTALLPSLMGQECFALLSSLKNKRKTVKLMGRFCAC